MGSNSSINNNPGEINQDKNMEEHPHQPISSEIRDTQIKKQDENRPPATEVEADFVLGDFIEQLLHKDNNNPVIDSNNSTDCDTAEIDPVKFENNSAIFDISDATVDSFLEKNLMALEEISSDSESDSVPEKDSTDSNPEINLIDVNIDTNQEKEQVDENISDDNPIEPVPVENSLKDVEDNNEFPEIDASDEEAFICENISFLIDTSPDENSLQYAKIKNELHELIESDENVAIGEESVFSNNAKSQEVDIQDIERNDEAHVTDNSGTELTIWEELLLPCEANPFEKSIQDDEGKNELLEMDDFDTEVSIWERLFEANKIDNNLQKIEQISETLVENELYAIFETSMSFEEETEITNPEDSISNESQMDKVSHVSKFKMLNDKLSYLYNGTNFYLKKNFEDAIIEFKKGLKIDPDNELGYILLGNSYFRNNMLIEALAIYEKLKNKFPVDSLVLENLGVIYSKLGMYQLAAKEWKTLLRIDPEKIEIKNKLEKALHYLSPNLEQPVVKNGDELDKLIFDGIDFYKNKDYDSAIQAFKGAINGYPDEKDAYNFLANTYFRNKMLKEAILTYENFICKYKGNISAYENIGLIYAKQGEYNKALCEWEKVIEANPERRDIKIKIESVLQLI